MPIKKSTALVPELVTDHVKIRTAGLQLITPLTAAVSEVSRIDSATEYLDADEVLGRVRNARQKWATLLDPIKSPLDRAEAEIKLAKKGVKNLDAEVDGPLEQLELNVKSAMRDFKLREAIETKRKELEASQEQERQQRAIEEARQREAAAKTAPMRAKLAETRARLEAQAEQTADADMNPVVKGSSSAARTIQKVRIADVGAFVRAIRDYEPKAGIHEMGHPPLSIITPELLQTKLNALYRDEPGVVKSWPGVVVESDIIIAGR